jgi:hypothetical protein
MTRDPAELRRILQRISTETPLPVAHGARYYLEAEFDDRWHEWEVLTRDALGPSLKYLAHLLLSDLVATGRKPAHLFHWIESILSRPMAGHYVGFLRETCRYYRTEGLACSVPELLEFLQAAELDCGLTKNGKPLLGLLVDYRNLRAHGRFDNPAALEQTVETIRGLMALFYNNLGFLSRYPLELEDGTALMGASLPDLSEGELPLVGVKVGPVSLRPLLLKLKGKDVCLLEDVDFQGRKLIYRGSTAYQRFGKKETRKGPGQKILDELLELLTRVRALESELERPDWLSFSERAGVLTDRTLADYNDLHRYIPASYVPSGHWEGADGLFADFLAGQTTMLAITGAQGTGKSALLARLAEEAGEDGHAALLINAQRFSYARVQWSEPPYSAYLASQLKFKFPLGARDLARIRKGAPEGKQAVLLIDGLDEVDGLERKWNRFRAMEMFLEWVQTLTSSGVKVVLSFDLDSYLELGYLQAAEIPDRIEGLSYRAAGHARPDHPWVNALGDFGQDRAEALYDKLQALPEMGMAPAMPWKEIQNGLGEEAAEFMANPLLFMVFLRSHHGEEEVRHGSRLQIFERYAEKLTGADQRLRAPWWRKVGWFLRDGNITPQERFLADAIEKMAENGSASFLVEDLHRKNKRDKRIGKFMEPGNDRAYQDMKEGGLFFEESVEISQGEESHVSRRVSVVGELMAAALDPILGKIHTRKKWVDVLVSSLWMNLSIVILFFAGFRPLGKILIRNFLEQGLPVETAYQVKEYVDRNVIIACLCFVVILTAGNIFGAQRSWRYSISQIGMMGLALQQKAGRYFSAKFWQITGPCLAIVFAYLFFKVDAGIGSEGVLLEFAGAALPLLAYILVLAFFISGPGIRLLLSSSPLVGPARLVTSLAHRKLEIWDSPDRPVRFRRALIPALGTLSICALLSLYARHQAPIETSQAPAMDMLSLVAVRTLEYTSYMISGGFQDILALGCLVLGLVYAVGSLLLTASSMHSAKLENRLLTEEWVTYARTDGWGRIRLTVLLLVIGLTAGGEVVLDLTRLDEAKLVRDLGLDESEYTFNEAGYLTRLDLSRIHVTPELVKPLNRCLGLEELHIGESYEGVIPLSRIPLLSELHIPAAALGNSINDNLDKLYLTGPVDLSRFEATELNILGLAGSVPDLTPIGDTIKGLIQLELSEDQARETAPSLADDIPNLFFWVKAEKPRLDWLTTELAGQVILRVEGDPGPAARNLEHVRRICLPLRDLNPTTLQKLVGVQWLMLLVEEPPPAETLSGLKVAVQQDLPSLRALEFITLTEEKNFILESLLSGLSNEEHLELLDRLIQDPKSVYRPDLDQEES